MGVNILICILAYLFLFFIYFRNITERYIIHHTWFWQEEGGQNIRWNSHLFIAQSWCQCLNFNFVSQ